MGAEPNDVAAILEAAYAVEGDEASWLRGVLDHASRRLGAQHGVMAFTVRFEDDAHVLGTSMLAGGDDVWAADWRRDWWEPFIARIDTPSLRGMMEFGATSTATLLWEAVAAQRPTLDAHLRALQVERGRVPTSPSAPDPGFRFPDSLNVCAIEGGGAALALVANRTERVPMATFIAERDELARTAGHLAAALRLRRRLGRGARTTDAEAIVDPRTGEIVHAEGAASTKGALDALQAAARDVDRARSGSRRYAADEALELWRCLVERRWTLADVFESDGRRYVVAIPNAPESECESLSDREAQVVHVASFGRSNKEIAYELGLAPTTVATLLGRAAKKLGAANVSQLIARARALRLGTGRDRSRDPRRP